MQNFVGKTKCIVGYMKVANGELPVASYFSSFARSILNF